MTVFCTSITNKAHQTDDYRLATNAIYSKLLDTDFNVESGETPEPTPTLDTKPDTARVPVSGDRRRHDRYRVGHGSDPVCGRCAGALRQEACGLIFFPNSHITWKTAPSALQAEEAAFSAGCRKWENVV